MESALGVSRNTHEINSDKSKKKSISVSQTFKPIIYKGEFIEMIEVLSERLSLSLSQQELVGKHLSLELKDSKYNGKI